MEFDHRVEPGVTVMTGTGEHGCRPARTVDVEGGG